MWATTKAAAAKGVRFIRASGGAVKLVFVILAAVVFLPLLLFGVIFVSIVWTHRPDLSVFDIMREAVKEIKIMRAGKERQKGKTE